MENYIKKLGKESLVTSILLFILSIFLIFKPLQSVGFMIIAFGCILVLSGILHIISYFSIKDEFRAFSFELVEGAISIIAGFAIIFNTELVRVYITIYNRCMGYS